MPDGVSKIPVYLPDDTRVGTATINVADGIATIKIQADSSVAELIQESLVGLSIVYLNRDAVEEVLNKENKSDA